MFSFPDNFSAADVAASPFSLLLLMIALGEEEEDEALELNTFEEEEDDDQLLHDGEASREDDEVSPPVVELFKLQLPESSCSPSRSASASCLLLTSSSIMSTSPTRVDPSLKRTRFLWARRQFCLSSSRMASMAEQILRAGPNLMDMADMRWSALSSIRAWPSISCSWKSST